MFNEFKSSNFVHILKNNVDTSGRASRLELVQWYIHAFSMFVMLCVFTNFIGKVCASDFIIYVFALYLIIACFLSLMIKIRRLHDLNLSGGYLFLTFIPIANIILLIYLFFIKGTGHPNRFGEVPIVVKLNLFDKLLWLTVILCLCSAGSYLTNIQIIK